MAKNILSAGFELMAYDRQEAPLRELRALGAQIAGSVSEVGQFADIIEIAVAPQPQVEGLILGEGGLLSAMRPGALIDIHSTAPPDALQRIAEAGKRQGVAVLDAQMSGGNRGAQAGTLCFMIGGDSDTLERARPVLNACGTNIYHVGAVGAGSHAKIAHNAIIALTLVANAEGFAFAERAGVDPEVFQEIVRDGAAQSHVGDDWLDHWSLMEAPPYGWILESFLGIGGSLGLTLPGASLAQEQLPLIFTPMSDRH
jgi:3-hydroxyisobutyrate dehydrogenase-like beta-hydroxyacid dehydrogenase